MPNPRDVLTSQNAPLWCVLLGLLVLGGILFGQGREVRATGSTRAGDDLYRHTAHRLAVRARAASLCDRVSAIHTEILHDVPWDAAASGSPPQRYPYGSMQERWTVSLCQRQLPYRVTFTTDGAGSVYASIGGE